jgi:hypothetical protein
MDSDILSHTITWCFTPDFLNFEASRMSNIVNPLYSHARPLAHTALPVV